MRRARDAPAADAADVDEQSFQNEAFAPAPRRRGRGRGRGKHRAPVAQELEQEPLVEPVAPEIDPTAFAAGMTGINQGLAALNQAMPLVQQRNQEMTDADAAVLYTRVGRVPFDGTGDAMDFINTIEARTRTGYNDYQKNDSGAIFASRSSRLVYAVNTTIHDYYDLVGIQGTISEIFLSIFDERE